MAVVVGFELVVRIVWFWFFKNGMMETLCLGGREITGFMKSQMC